MIVDTSAIMAILLKEEDADRYLRALDGAPIRRMSGVSTVELTIVADRKDNPVPGALVDDFVGTAKILVEPVTAEQIALARGVHLLF